MFSRLIPKVSSPAPRIISIAPQNISSFFSCMIKSKNMLPHEPIISEEANHFVPKFLLLAGKKRKIVKKKHRKKQGKQISLRYR